MNRVVLESRHKFVYYDNESINGLRELEYEYPAKVNSEEPVVVYIQDDSLPKVDTKLVLDKDRIIVFHCHYYELLIFLAIINQLANQIEHSELNNRLERVFKLCSHIGKSEIKDIDTLRDLLIESKNIYKEAYLEYMNSGKCDFYDKVPIPFIMMDSMIQVVKKALDLKKHFSLLLEFREDMSIYTCRAINDHIASRCNGYLSMNVLLHSDSEWKSYYANNGQFIQDTHDYTEKDFRKHKSRKREYT